MRTLTHLNETVNAANAPAKKPWHKLMMRDSILRFSSSAYGSISSVDFESPTVFFLSPSVKRMAYRRTDGMARVTSIDPQVPGGWTSTAVNTLSNAAMKGSFDSAGKFYTATWTFGGSPSCQRYGTNGALEGTYTALPGVTCINDAASKIIKRIEAVNYTSFGLIVCVGMHDFIRRHSTLSFFFQPFTGIALPLETMIQIEMAKGDEYSSNWYQKCKWAAYCFAQDLGNGKILIVANDHVKGRAVRFFWENGIESEVEPVIPIDLDASDVTFKPTGILYAEGLYRLSGIFNRPKSDGSADRLEVYLTSVDGVHWSVGERSFFVTKEIVNGSLSYLSNVYYWMGASGSSAGNSLWASSSAMQNEVDITAKTLSAKVDTLEDAADQLSIAKSPSLSISPGSIVSISAGYNDPNYGCKIGEYVAEGDTILNESGLLSPPTVPLVDYARWRIMDWRASVDIDRRSKTVYEANLSRTAMILKTSVRNLKATANGWVSLDLNTPCVAYAPSKDERDGMAEATVQFHNGSDKCVSSFGFVFGASGLKFNLVSIPRVNSWSGHTKAAGTFMSNLAPVSESDGSGGFNFESMMTGLLETNLTDAYSRIAVPATEGWTYTGSPTVLQPAKQYDLVMRKSKRRVQLYVREHDPQDASKSIYSLAHEYIFNERQRILHGPRPSWGMAFGTDVWVSKTAFESSAFGDINVGITEAGNHVKSSAHYTELVAGHYRFAGQPPTRQLIFDTAASRFNVGLRVKITRTFTSGGPEVEKGYRTVEGVSGNIVAFSHEGHDIFDEYEECIYRFYGPMRAQNPSGYASSKYKIEEVVGVVDTGASKALIPLRGLAAFVNNDHTAMSVRWVETDGVMHNLHSTSPLTKTGWDPVSPIEAPRLWRMVFRHGFIFAGQLSDHGLPSPCYMIVDDEIIRAETYETPLPGYGQTVTHKWTMMPVAYFTAKGQPAGLSTITQWKLGSDRPGTLIENLDRPAGMLVELVNQTSNRLDPLKPPRVLRVVSISSADPPVITLDQPLEIPLQEPVQYTDGGDLVVLSGRAQLGTDKSLHPSDAPVLFYPLDFPATAPLDHLIRISRFNVYSGLYNSVEDDLKYCCSLMGIREILFRNLGSYSGTLSSTPQTLNASLSDFVLDFRGHLYSQTANGFPSGAEGRLRIEFRNYKLDIQHWINQGSPNHPVGNVRLLLQQNNPDINYQSMEAPFLAVVTVPVANYDISGAYNGSTHTEDVNKVVNLRVAVKKNIISVEINGQHVWTFNLKTYSYVKDGTAKDCYSQAAGPVKISYTYGSAPVSVRLLELSQEVEDHIVDMGADGAETLSAILNDRHIRHRATQNGGIEFSRWWARDYAGSVSGNMKAAQELKAPMEQPGHVVMSGAEFGEHISAPHIVQNGYSFAMGQNRLLDTVQDSAEEAELSVRLGLEQSLTVALEGVARVEIQPEDYVTLSYSKPGTDLPSRSAEDFVVSSVSYAFGAGKSTAQYQLRKKFP